MRMSASAMLLAGLMITASAQAEQPQMRVRPAETPTPAPSPGDTYGLPGAPTERALRARANLEASLAEMRRLGDRWAQGLDLVWLAHLTLAEGNPAHAAELAQEAGVDVSRQLRPDETGARPISASLTEAAAATAAPRTDAGDASVPSCSPHSTISCPTRGTTNRRSSEGVE